MYYDEDALLSAKLFLSNKLLSLKSIKSNEKVVVFNPDMVGFPCIELLFKSLHTHIPNFILFSFGIERIF